MTLPQAILQNAAFWHDEVCLSCGHIQSPPDSGEVRSCEECESAEVLPAETILKCHDFVEEEQS